MKPRYLGLDYGDKRIGVAMSDGLYLTAQPKGVIANTGLKAVLKEIDVYAKDYMIETIVLGLPLGLSGQDTEQTKKVRGFKNKLEKKLSYKVCFHDESLTSKEAEAVLIQGGMSRKKRKGKIDAMAAQLMLQSYMDQNPLC